MCLHSIKGRAQYLDLLTVRVYEKHLYAVAHVYLPVYQPKQGTFACARR